MTDFYSAWDDDTPTGRAAGTVVPIAAAPAAAGHISRYAAKALEAEVQAVLDAPVGTRNDTLNRASYNLGQLVAGGELPQQDVVEALSAAGHTVGLSVVECDKTIFSGLKAGAKQPRQASPQVPAQPVAHLPTVTVPPAEEGGEPTEQVDHDAVKALFPRVDWKALWADDEPEEWIVEPILPARRLVALYSAPKVGKSLLMLEIAVCVAKGAEVLGTTPDRPRRVLYVDFENDPRGDVRERLEAMGYGPDDLDNLVYLSYPSLGALDGERGSLELLAAIDAYGCEVVVIDTVSRSVAGDENENDTWLNFYRHTGLKMKQHGVAMIRLDHAGKDETKGQRGGSAKVGDVDAVWKLAKVTDDTFRLDCEANRMPVNEKQLTLTRLTVPVLRHKVEGGGWKAANDAAVLAVIKAMDDAGLPRDTGSTRAREVARAAGIKARNNVIAEAVRRRKNSPNGLAGAAL